ncbi:MAG: NRAMP family divalent metal transporter [Candidatus Saccharibacteria bacterium]
MPKDPKQKQNQTVPPESPEASAPQHSGALQRVGRYWHMLGPGLTTGAADDDPSGIATYSQVGAKYGFRMLWLSPLSFPLMAVVQEMCARIGLVTGRGLAGNIRRRYPRWVLYLCTALLFFANTFNIGADLGAMGKATQLLLPRLDFSLLVVFFALFSLLLQVLVSYRRYAGFLKWLSLVLLAYVLSALVIDLDWLKVLKETVTPSLRFNREEILLVTGVLGTTISPYLFFWQTSQEIEEQIMEGKKTIKQRAAVTTPEEISKMRVDVWFGMFLSNLVMFFIIAACGATLFRNGITQIATAAEAAEALRPFAGDLSYFLFTIGIVGVGLLGIPVLAGSASYDISESFGWREGLYRKFRQAQAFYGIIILSVLAGLIMNFVGLDPIKALIYSAIANGVVAPVILILIVVLSSDRKVMGERANGPALRVVGWLAVVLMLAASLSTLYFLVF